MLKIVSDDQIPNIREVFSSLGEIITIPSREIHAQTVSDADILLIRSVTRADARLLQGSHVRFVGSATAGLDHLDTSFLNQAGILWGYAAGMNATAVAEYVLCCVAYLRKEGYLPTSAIQAAVVGVGHVGSLVADRLRRIGYTVLENDPPRKERDPLFRSASLSDVLNADLICIHTPLATDFTHPTHHLFNEAFLKRLKPGCILINAGRGAVMDNDALLKVGHMHTCLDVWEHEPHLNLELLKKVLVATPHIAGYTYQAKQNATEALYQQVLKFIESKSDPVKNFPKPKIRINATHCKTWEEVLLHIYNPLNDTEGMRKCILQDPNNTSDIFENLRQNYLLRNEFSSIELIVNVNHRDINLLNTLGFDVKFFSS